MLAGSLRDEGRGLGMLSKMKLVIKILGIFWFNSEMREIPDNQEVFCHPTTDQSIMIDILEYQNHVQGEHAARYMHPPITHYKFEEKTGSSHCSALWDCFKETYSQDGDKMASILSSKIAQQCIVRVMHRN